MMGGIEQFVADLLPNHPADCQCREMARQQDKKVATLTAERDAWREDAKVRAQNMDYWRQLADQRAQDLAAAREALERVSNILAFRTEFGGGIGDYTITNDLVNDIVRAALGVEASA